MQLDTRIEAETPQFEVQTPSGESQRLRAIRDAAAISVQRRLNQVALHRLDCVGEVCGWGHPRPASRTGRIRFGGGRCQTRIENLGREVRRLDETARLAERDRPLNLVFQLA